MSTNEQQNPWITVQASRVRNGAAHRAGARGPDTLDAGPRVAAELRGGVRGAAEGSACRV